MRRDPSGENTKAYDYVQQATILTDENTHGGNDVAIHAVGKFSRTDNVLKFFGIIKIPFQVLWLICFIVSTSSHM